MFSVIVFHKKIKEKEKRKLYKMIMHYNTTH